MSDANGSAAAAPDRRSAERPRSRSAAVDTVRIVGILAVIAGHVWSTGLIRPLVYTWHVPLFFFLSGYFWTTRRPFRVELSKRWGTLARPYIAWLVVLSVAFIPALALQHRLAARDLAAILLGGSYLGRPYSAFWFMGALFFAAVAYRLLQSIPLWAQWVIGIILLGAGYLIPSVVSDVPLGAGTGLCCIIFLVSGATLRRYRASIRHPAWFGILGLLLSALLIGFGIARPFDLKYGDFGTVLLSPLVAVLISAGFVLLAETGLSALGPRATRTITTLTACGTAVILSHAAVLWLLRTPTDGNVVDFTAAVVIPWVVALILLRTPLSPWLLGAPARSARTRKRPATA